MSGPESTDKTYRGNCHCGAYVFEFRMPEIKSAKRCNCSICTKKGYLWLEVGKQSSYTVVRDEGKVTEYTFGPGKAIHRFCGACGTALACHIPSWPEGKNLGINVIIYLPTYLFGCL